jgi:hypothetical protein
MHNASFLTKFILKKSFFVGYNKFLTTETNSKPLYTYHCFFTISSAGKAICSDCTDFCLQLCFSEKGKATLKNLSHFENESTFRKRTTFWK